jgi:maltose alpha-D-glucosyltransferase/alpha-amylase
MGGVTFPRIGELSYLLTLPGHGFYWFQLPAARDDRSSAEHRSAASGDGAEGEHGPPPATVERLPGPPESHQQ